MSLEHVVVILKIFIINVNKFNYIIILYCTINFFFFISNEHVSGGVNTKSMKNGIIE